MAMKNEKIISNIVFTRNRPLQLDAYLESLFRYFPKRHIRTYILYKVELFEEEYEQLFRKYPDCIVVRENDFHTDFLRILTEVDTKYILFGVDDVVYLDSIDLNVVDVTFEQYKDVFGFTMRFSPESLKDSNDVITDITVGGEKVYRLNWKKGQTPHTKYPFELCCTIYRTDLVRKIIDELLNHNPVIRRLFSPGSFLIKAIGKVKSTRSILKTFGYFFSPNTFESWPCRWCRNNKDKVPDFTCFQKLCAVAVQVNMVNTSTKNTFDGTQEHTVEALNRKYRDGFRLDIDFVAAQRPNAPSCGQRCFRLINT